MSLYAINQQYWDRLTLLHKDADWYEIPAFKAGQSSLRHIELKDLAPQVGGQRLLHLQCHFGMDTLSLARLGAEATGVDFSAAAIAQARELAAELGIAARFVEADVLHLDLGEAFDWVFSSYGVLGWLGDLPQWARVVARHLRPGGRLYLLEFHPVFYTFGDDGRPWAYPYASSDDPEVEHSTGSYARPDAQEALRYAFWSHGLADVVQALIDAGLRLDLFQEYDYSPYDCMPHMKALGPQRFVYAHTPQRLPYLFKIVATKV